MPRRDLADYHRKRDPGKTPEPFGSRHRRGRPIFVVQRHDARRLHYDFRLERDGALASWAVPKGVPLEAGQRSLAVHVEDHPLDYATFEGEIPQGQYGAGTVEIWDHGTYELVEEKKDGGLTVRLDGERLQGMWTLVPAKLDGDPKNWLLIRKRSDDGAAPAQGAYEPMLATLETDVPKGAGWLYEVKWDGYRALAYVRGGEARLVSRNGNDLTQRFAAVAKEVAKAVKSPECVLDGEVCALDDKGRPSFSAMQQGKPGTPILFEAFDLLELEGESLIGLPLTERHDRLGALLDRRNRTVRLSETFDDGGALLAAAKAQGLEGIMAKRADSPYRPGKRTREWLKIKTHGRQEFVIAGYTKGQGRRSGRFGALVLGVWRGGELAYVGNCGTGFTDKDIDELLARLRPLEQKESPFSAVPYMPKVRKGDVVWVEPELVCEVEFAEWTHDGRLRAPSFQGLRDDKACARRAPRGPDPAGAPPGQACPEAVQPRQGLLAGGGDHEGRPARLLPRGRAGADPAHPRPAVHDEALPRRDRGQPFLPEGRARHTCRSGSRRASFEVSTRESPRRRRRIQVPLVNDELALLWMVNMACIDLNTWYSRVDKPDRPDFVLFDLDPAADAGFPEVIEVALLVKQVLDALGLVGFAKTSGSKGMHVLVPVERRHTYDETREFAEIVAGTLARTHRGLVTTEWTKAKRRGVLIDANQNGEGKTIASVYSVRPRPGAPVSTPLSGTEVQRGPRPARLHDGRRARADPAPRRPVRGRARRLDSASEPPYSRSGEARPARRGARRLLPHPRRSRRRLGAGVRAGLSGAVLARLRGRRLGGPLERAGRPRRGGRDARGDVRVPQRPDRRRARARHVPLRRAPARLRGRARLPPLSRETFEAMRANGISFYNAHAPLDMHPEVSPSRLCAEGVGLEGLEEYFPICAGIPGGAAIAGQSRLTVDGLADALRSYLGSDILVHVLTRPRAEAGQVAMVAGGGATIELLEASLERGCQTYVTGNAATNCRLDFVQEEVRVFRERAEAAGVALIDAMHYGMEKPPQWAMARWFRERGLEAEFVPDGPK